MEITSLFGLNDDNTQSHGNWFELIGYVICPLVFGGCSCCAMLATVSYRLFITARRSLFWCSFFNIFLFLCIAVDVFVIIIAVLACFDCSISQTVCVPFLIMAFFLCVCRSHMICQELTLNFRFSTICLCSFFLLFHLQRNNTKPHTRSRFLHGRHNFVIFLLHFLLTFLARLSFLFLSFSRLRSLSLSRSLSVSMCFVCAVL